MLLHTLALCYHALFRNSKEILSNAVGVWSTYLNRLRWGVFTFWREWSSSSQTAFNKCHCRNSIDGPFQLSYREGARCWRTRSYWAFGEYGTISPISNTKRLKLIRVGCCTLVESRKRVSDKRGLLYLNTTCHYKEDLSIYQNARLLVLLKLGMKYDDNRSS